MHTQLLQLCIIMGSCVCNYSCRNERYGRDFHSDGLCMSGIGTVRLRSYLKEEDIVYANYENDKVNYHTIPILLCEISFDYLLQ